MQEPLIIESLNTSPPLELMEISTGIKIIGRDAHCDVVVDDPGISREHASIVSAGGYWVFFDLGSTNGSWVNGIKVDEKDIIPLRSGDLIQIASLPLRVKDLIQSEDTKNVPTLLLFQKREFISEFNSEEKRRSIQIGGDDADYKIDDEDHDSTEVTITYDSGKAEVGVHPKSGDVFLNGEIVRGSHQLKDKDILVVLDYCILVCDPLTEGHREKVCDAPPPEPIMEDMQAAPGQEKGQSSFFSNGSSFGDSFTSNGSEHVGPKPVYTFGTAIDDEAPTASSTRTLNRRRLESRYARRNSSSSGGGPGGASILLWMAGGALLVALAVLLGVLLAV